MSKFKCSCGHEQDWCGGRHDTQLCDGCGIIIGGFIDECPYCYGTGKIEVLGGPDQICECQMDELD